ncbi:MAG: peroxiredoxin family protein [Acidobacteriota bacterium]|nr:MAG: peroxiredoxin family protein [Acidobacteriota bacterium]
MQEQSGQFARLGIDVWAISPDKPEKVRRWSAAAGVTITQLYDRELLVTRRYGILNEQSGSVPHPTAVIVDRDGMIRYVRIDRDYKVRPTVDELVDAVGELEGRSEPSRE